MRLADRYLLVLGVLAILSATIWGAAGGETAAVVSLLVIGVLLAVTDIGLWVSIERRLGSLVVPAELRETASGDRLPTPAWWWPALFIGMLTGVGGLVVDEVWLIVIGVLMVIAALAGIGASGRSGPRVLPDRRLVKDGRNVRRFLDRHPGTATPQGFVVDLGQHRAKLVVVAADGEYGDLVTASPQRAQLAGELAGLPLVEPTDGTAGRSMRTGPPVWQGMAHGRTQGAA